MELVAQLHWIGPIESGVIAGLLTVYALGYAWARMMDKRRHK